MKTFEKNIAGFISLFLVMSLVVPDWGWAEAQLATNTETNSPVPVRAKAVTAEVTAETVPPRPASSRPSLADSFDSSPLSAPLSPEPVTDLTDPAARTVLARDPDDPNELVGPPPPFVGPQEPPLFGNDLLFDPNALPPRVVVPLVVAPIQNQAANLEVESDRCRWVFAGGPPVLHLGGFVSDIDSNKDYEVRISYSWRGGPQQAWRVISPTPRVDGTLDFSFTTATMPKGKFDEFHITLYQRVRNPQGNFGPVTSMSMMTRSMQNDIPDTVQFLLTRNSHLISTGTFSREAGVVRGGPLYNSFWGLRPVYYLRIERGPNHQNGDAVYNVTGLYGPSIPAGPDGPLPTPPPAGLTATGVLATIRGRGPMIRIDQHQLLSVRFFDGTTRQTWINLRVIPTGVPGTPFELQFQEDIVPLTP